MSEHLMLEPQIARKVELRDNVYGFFWPSLETTRFVSRGLLFC